MNWYAMTDNALAQSIGAYVKHHRLEQNKTQQEVAHQAGISRSTLSLLERGQTVTVTTLIQVLRTLELLHIFNNFEVITQPSPLALAKLEMSKRKRATASNANEPQDPAW